jgi:putative SOS response-associated peptidase YedK
MTPDPTEVAPPPVILPPDRIDAWLDPKLTDKDAVQQLISGIEYEPLKVRACIHPCATRPSHSMLSED